jgi:hypothetical protein
MDLDGDGKVTGWEKLIFWTVTTLVTAIVTALMVM